MSRSLHPSTVRILAAAGILASAGLLAPAAAPAQTTRTEQALLYVTPAVSFHQVLVAPAPAPAIDGASALLGQSVTDLPDRLPAAPRLEGDARPVDPEQALLGKLARSDARRLTLAL